MLSQVLKYLKNYFVAENRLGNYKIENGSITLPFLYEGQYFRIIGSIFNDGVYQYPVNGLKDEEFGGAVWALAIPDEVISLAGEIENWQKQYGASAEGPYQSESFGGYSYTLKSAGEGKSGISWSSAFADRLNQWRKI